jgi:hypothetical protein
MVGKALVPFGAVIDNRFEMARDPYERIRQKEAKRDSDFGKKRQ